jgi:RimJ/RimL family protein N-acetyltransferase
MLFEPRRFTLKDGREAVLRNPDPERDAAAMVKYLTDTAAETEFVLRYPEECSRYTVESERSFLEGFNANPNSLFLTCFVGERLAGNCELQFNTQIKYRHKASVAIALYREFWGQGIGTAMFRAMEEVARQRGVMLLELEYIGGNERGRGLYEKMGFRITGVRPDAIRLKDGRFLNEYMMVKKL